MTYTAEFFARIVEGSLRSARIVLPQIIAETGTRSVVDVGCGTGAWLAAAKAEGCDVLGVDGFAEDGLLIDIAEFERCDLSEGFGCAGFDLAMCLEVAEHLPESSAAALVAGLCHAPFVLFSPAIPGQGGVGHVNEQWGSWWEPLFAAHGYVGSSDLRWRHWADREVENWYRQNMLMFATPRRLGTAGYRPGVVDVIHPERLGVWP